MKTLAQIILSVVMFSCFNSLQAQVAPAIEWQKCLGGGGNEAAFSVQQTTDGGFITAGFSDLNGGDVTGNHGSDDYWIMKLDSASNLLWEKSLGGNSIDDANSIMQTSDGGFIVAGRSYSTNDDVSGNHGSDDYWIVKLSSDGNIEWKKCFGGSGEDEANCIRQTADGGYIVAGGSDSTSGDVTGNHGMWDYWVVKLDIDGGLQWEQSFGGSQDDVAYSAQQATDGGYVIAGYSQSSDGDVSGNNGDRDYWVVKTDTGGNIVWEKVLGGSSIDEAHSIQQLSDGGFIVAGYAASIDGDVSGNHGGYDYWMVKLDSAANAIWKYCFGGMQNDQPFSVQQTTDGGFIVVGQSGSNNGDVSGNHGGYDFWMLKLDKEANLEWQKSLGGSNDEYGPYGVQQTTDGGFIVAGATLSNNDDVSGNHGGASYGDCWVVKLASDLPTGSVLLSKNFFTLSPNPVQTKLEIKLTTPPNEMTVQVYDLQGRIMRLPISDSPPFAAQGQLPTSSIQINTTSLADGFYTVQITNSKTGEREAGKFMKQ